jgi:hypothetical protein
LSSPKKNLSSSPLPAPPPHPLSAAPVICRFRRLADLCPRTLSSPLPIPRVKPSNRSPVTEEQEDKKSELWRPWRRRRGSCCWWRCTQTIRTSRSNVAG